MAIVAWISWILACVSLMAAARAATRALAFFSPEIPFSYSSSGTFLLGMEAGQSPLLAFLLPLVGLGFLELRPVLEQLGFARGQHRLHIVVFDDGQRIALLDLHPLVDVHPLDAARDLRPDHRLGARLEISLGAQELLGFAGGHPLDQSAGHFRPGAQLIVLAVAVDARSPHHAQGDQPEQPGEEP